MTMSIDDRVALHLWPVFPNADDLFAGRGWQRVRRVPRSRRYVWQKWRRPLIEPDIRGRGYSFILVGGRLVRPLSIFGGFQCYRDCAVAAMDFCDRIAPLADWSKAGEWDWSYGDDGIVAPPDKAELIERCAAIRLGIWRRLPWGAAHPLALPFDGVPRP
jgi:hypothetical protein